MEATDLQPTALAETSAERLHTLKARLRAWLLALFGVRDYGHPAALLAADDEQTLACTPAGFSVDLGYRVISAKLHVEITEPAPGADMAIEVRTRRKGTHVDLIEFRSLLPHDASDEEIVDAIRKALRPHIHLDHLSAFDAPALAQPALSC